MDDLEGNWPKWLSGVLNIASGTVQAAVGAALGVAVGWTGVGAFVAGFLMVNGAATISQGVGQVINDVAETTVLPEDNVIKSTVQSMGQLVGGDTGSIIAGNAYDSAVIVSTMYAGFTGARHAINQNMPQIVNSKLFSMNDGYGLKIGKYIEILYRNPNAQGGTGGTLFSYKGPWGKIRIDWDPVHKWHMHPPGHK